MAITDIGPLAAGDGTLEAYEGAVWITADSAVYTADNDVTQVNTAGQIRDAAAFTGTVQSVVTGVLAATEAGAAVPWKPTDLGSALKGWFDGADAATVTILGGGVSAWGNNGVDPFALSQPDAALRPTYANSIVTFPFTGPSGYKGKHLLAANSPAAYDLLVVGNPHSSVTTTDWRTLLFSVGPQNTILVQQGTSNYGTYNNNFFQAGALTWDNVPGLSYARISTTGPIQLSRDGGPLVSTGTTLTADTSILCLGSVGAYTGGDLDQAWGDVYELFFVPYNSADDVRQKLEGYAAHKWGLAALLPSGHPYKTAPPVGAAGVGGDTAAFAGTVGYPAITGVLAAIEGADTAAFAGTVAWPARTGTLAATEGADVAAFTGQVRWLATLAATEGADTASFAGTATYPVITGTLAVTEGSDAAAFAGTVVFPTRTGTLAATEGVADTVAFTGSVQWFATLAAIEGSDAASFTGLVGRSGTLVATEAAADIAAFSGQVQWFATLAATEGADAAAFTGTVAYPAITGVLAATEAPDVVVITGVAGLVTGTLAATESGDVSAFAGRVAWEGTLAATDGADVVSFAGKLGAVGTLAAIEARDALAAAGYVSFVDEKIGVLDAFESGGVGGALEPTADSTLVTADQTIFTADMDGHGGDAAHFTGGAVVSAVLVATEGADGASFVGSLSAVIGVLAAIEDRDTADFAAERVTVIRGVLAAREDADVAYFYETSSFESAGEGLRDEVLRTQWLASLERRVVWLTNEVEDMTSLQNINGRVLYSRNEVQRIMEL